MAVEQVQLNESTVGFVARPAAADPQPGVIIIHEIHGINDYMKEVAQQVADRGFVALAIDLFEGQTAQGMQDGLPLREKVTEPVFRDKIGAGIRYLQSLPGCSGRLGITGFCMGGGLTLQAACLFPDQIQAASMFYGRINDLSLLQNLKQPLIGNFGAEDTGIGTWVGAEFWPEMMKLNKTLDVKMYAGAPHGFARHTDPKVYRPEAATDAWERTYALFNSALRS